MEFWNKCSERLEDKLSQDDFNTWIRPLKANLKEDILELVAPNDFILNYVETNLVDEITNMVKSQSKKSINLVFKTHTKETFVDKYKNQSKAEDTKLVPSYVFETFVEGKSNHLALAASKQVASNPKGDYNPLFIYGGVGLGKTHLMHAVGNEILKNEPGKRIVYVHSEKFVSDMVKALQLGAMNEFKSFYRNADALLIDDIQFFAGKEQSQEEFFHTFNALLDKGSQIVISADRAPNKLARIQDRIKSRFAGGLVVDIQKPDYELRKKIVEQKSKELNTFYPNQINISEEIQKFISTEITTSIRELVGAINRVVSFSRIYNKVPNLSEIKVVLKDLLNISDNKVTIDSIQSIVCKFFKISKNEMLSPRRSRYLVRPRQTAIYLTKILTSKSLPEIGREFSNRDHTTIIHSVKTIEKLMEKNEEMTNNVNKLKNQILYNKENEI